MSSIKKEGKSVIVKPGRDVVASMAKEFMAELHDVVQKAPEKIIIDLTGVEMVDSVGIGVIIATHNSINKAGGVLKVINAEKDIFGLFNTMNLNRHFEIEKVK